MGPIYLFMERSFEPPAQFEQVRTGARGAMKSRRGARKKECCYGRTRAVCHTAPAYYLRVIED